jgi:phenylacetate-CoA ligase
LYTSIYRPVWQLRAAVARSPLFRYWQELEDTQWLSQVDLERLQLARLQRLLHHAYQHVPFYRRRFEDAGLHPDHVHSLADLRRLPVLTRDDVRQHLAELVARDVPRQGLLLNATGGSTGQPVSFYQDQTYQTYKVAAKLRYRRWYGFQRGDKVAFLWGMDRDLPDSGCRKRVSLALRRERWLNSFNVSSEKMLAFAQRLASWQPKVIIGYASSLQLFASFLKENGLDEIHPLAVESSAERLWDFQRTFVEEVFDCPVFNVYGSREFGPLAAECDRHTGLHAFTDLRVIEIVRNNQPVADGELGEVLVTNLTNFAMPLIRYQIGDLARPTSATCECGRGFPLLSEIVGRSSDIISTPDGHYIHGEFFTHLFYGVPGVRKFQVRQKALNDIEILIESDEELPSQFVDKLRAKITDLVGHEVRLTFRRVDNIPLTRSGKHRFTVSDVPLSLTVAKGVSDV